MVSMRLNSNSRPIPEKPARALRAIASSGELARVMLALKTVLAVVDQVPVLVFDEVDANVGGETANAVAEKMQQIAPEPSGVVHYAFAAGGRAGRGAFRCGQSR